MPKRWEQELRRLGDVPAPTERIHARSTRVSEPRPSDGMPPTRQRVLASIVAFGVFIAAGTFLVQAIAPSGRDRTTVGPASTLPTLQVSLQTSTDTQIGSDPAPWQIEAVIEYGEVRDESVTTSPPGPLPMSVEELPQLFPAPTVGSRVSIESDAYNPRVMIAKVEDWPNLDKLERIDRLPSEPGDYVMLIEAEFASGPARVVRAVSLVVPGTVQIVATEGGEAGKATASIAIDGALTDGIRRASSFHYSDVISQFPGEPPPITPTFVHIEAEADVVVGEGPTNQQLRISAEPPPWDDGVGTRLPRESLAGIADGRYLLTYDVAWKHGKVSWTSEGTLEAARFAFPIEIVSVEAPSATPTQIPDTSAGELSDVLRIRCEEGRTTVLTPVVAAGPDGVEVEVLPLGGEHRVEFREEGYPDSSFGGSIPADGRSHPWSIAPGSAEVACNVSLEGTQPFEVVDPAGHFGGAELGCDTDAQAEVVGYDGGAAEWVDEPAAIRGILRGVLPDDRVMRPLYGRDRLDRWAIVRGGDVVGLVWFTWVTDASDPRGGGLGRVTGDVCSSSGIEGTVPPRDPDEDGVELDCRAESQVAFPPTEEFAAVADGAGYIRDKVPGVRSDDDVVPPPGVDGSEGFEGTWTVEREGKTVASVVYPTLQGITCRWNAIGIPESG